MVKPVAAAVAGALIAGVAMYTVGAKTARVDAFQTPELVQTVDGGWVKTADVSYGNALRPATQVVAAQPAPQPVAVPQPQPVRTVYRTVAAAPAQGPVVVAPAQEHVVVAPEDERSWKKTAMIIGGSAASGAGVGGIVKGKKGALIGAAIGGGAAAIYEATRRR
jgi:hypothetical protein